MARTSLASLVLAIVLVASNMATYAAVLGIDFGTEYIKAALVKPGIPLEIVLTKDSRRKEISAVTFKPSRNGPQPDEFPERLYGSDAMALAARFPGDVYPNLKALLGLPFEDPPVTAYGSRHPALNMEVTKRGLTAFKSKAFVDDVGPWTVEELIAMQLQSIQRNAEGLAGDGTSVKNVVLTVPPFYNTDERRAIQMAAELAGLKVLSLISDGLSVGLNYATSRTFPNVDDKSSKPEIHMVFDMGAGSTKASIMRFQSRDVKDVGKFNKTVQEVQVLGTGWDRTLGGDELNGLIIDDMLEQFVETSGAKKAGVAIESVKSHGRAIAKLSKEAERLRHILSANQKTSASFEGLYDEVDFRYSVSRSDFEEMAKPHAERVESVIQKALEMAGLQVSNLDTIILHGGASRTPFVQRQLEKFVGDAEKIRANVNSDEAAVFGAGFRAAEMSPSFRVKEIRIQELAVYPSGIKWVDGNIKGRHEQIWSRTSSLGGPPKEFTFSNRKDFILNFYQDEVDRRAPVKMLTTKNLTASVAEIKENYGCPDDDLQFKIAARLAGDNGEVEITKIAVECEVEEDEKEGIMDGVKNLFGFGKNKDSKDQQVLGDEAEAEAEADGSDPNASAKDAENSTSESASSSPSSASSEPSEVAEDGAAAERPKKLVSIPVAHTLGNTGVRPFEKAEITAMKDRLKAFANSDRQRKLREEALNELEGYTYRVRDLLESDAFIGASTEEERTTLNEKASETSDWIYDDGADAPRDELKNRLKELQSIVDPIQARAKEAEERPQLLADLQDALQQSKEFIVNIRDSITKRAEWEAAQSASSESSSTTAPPEPEESGEFAGLEDDALTMTEEDAMKDRGPVPPLYTAEDLAELDGMTQKMSDWLDEQVEKQKKLTQTEDPVLLVKDLKAKRQQLDKAGVDLAMKSVKNYEKREKKDKKDKKSSSKKGKGRKGQSTNLSDGEAETATGEAPPRGTPFNLEDLEGSENFIKLNPDRKAPTQEELDEIMRKIQEQQEGKKSKHDEL
ncbi:uncharacterized protein MKZ38_002188 [Zalerion maritima]|uniref:Uncharacterized protein n=1 Tax=Zalerion maritima TaxID=339359 RepID=A0AAD5WRF2_9PEZI|nr:uncharacterized protein MKZ38_002188 [Zalerion maritima]